MTEWQRLYNSKRWRARHSAQLQQHPLCAMCLAESRVTAAAIADHILPHHGNEELFFFGLLQSLCRHHHNKTKQEIEAKGYCNDIGLDGWPTDPNHPANRPKRQFSIPYGLKPSAIPVILVCGPPAAGKTTWVKDHARADDTVICLDDCRVAVGGKPWDQDKQIIKRALQYRDQLLYGLAHKNKGQCFLIVGAPTVAERTAWAQALGITKARGGMVVLDTPAETCLARLNSDPARRDVAQALSMAVLDWHRQAKASYAH
jgi:predicted kinase